MQEQPSSSAFEILTAIVLGLAAVATAWSTYQSGQWSGLRP